MIVQTYGLLKTIDRRFMEVPTYNLKSGLLPAIVSHKLLHLTDVADSNWITNSLLHLGVGQSIEP